MLFINCNSFYLSTCIFLLKDSTKTAVLKVHAVDSDNGIGGLVNYTLKVGTKWEIYDCFFVAF